MTMHAMRPGLSYDIAATTAPASGPVIPQGVRTLLLVASAPVRLTISPAGNVPATATSTMIAPNFPFHFACAAGDQVSAVTNTGAATLNVTYLSGG